MATAVLRSHDALDNRRHLDAFTPSPSKPRRRRQTKPASAASSPPKPAAAASPPPKMAAAASPPPKMAAATSPPRKMSAATSPPRKMSALTSPAPKSAVVASPAPKAAAATRHSPPARPVRKQPSPTKEKPKQRTVMEEVRILKRGEEPPAPAPAPIPVPTPVTAEAQAAPVDQRVLCTTDRIGPQEPAVVPTKIMAVSNATGYAGPAFSAAAPEPSCLPMPGFFFRRAEEEATRGLRCLLRIGS